MQRLSNSTLRRLYHVSAMPLYYSRHFTVPLNGGGSFPMERYELAIAATTHLLHPDTFIIKEPPLITDSQLELIHDRSYLRALFSNTLPQKEASKVGLGTWSPAWAHRTRCITGATLAATSDAIRTYRTPNNRHGSSRTSSASSSTSKSTLQGRRGDFIGPGGVACVAAGGTHHAFPSHGEGYCFVNDLAISAAWALQEGWHLGINRIGILDVDVHQGNGTAACLASDPRVVTVSLHGAKNYPWSSRYAGSYDIDLPDDTNDHDYSIALEEGLMALEGLSRAASHDPLSLLRLQRANCIAARRAGWGTSVLPPLPTNDEMKIDPLLAIGHGNSDDDASAPEMIKSIARSWIKGTTLPPTSRSSESAAAAAFKYPPAHNKAGLDLVLLQMGVDTLQNDRLGRLKVTRDGLKHRNERIFQWAENVGIPVVVTMGGGYGKDLMTSVTSHADVFQQAGESHKRRFELWEKMNK
jgi:acetoin utilization deacetylase AcuC-like enzyme